MRPEALGEIVVVDDSPEFVDAVVWAFRRLGVNPPRFTAASGDEALELLHRLPILPSLVLLDLNLPGLDGRAALREIRTDVTFSALPVAILSTSDDPTDVENARRLGADAYLVKPVRLEVLRDKLNCLFNALDDLSSLPFPL